MTKQEQPSPSAYCIWRKCLRFAYNPSSPSRLRLRAILPLQRPLGVWTTRSHVLHRCYWDEHTLYMRQSDNIFHHQRIVKSIIRDFLHTASPAIYHIVLLPFQQQHTATSSTTTRFITNFPCASLLPFLLQIYYPTFARVQYKSDAS